MRYRIVSGSAVALLLAGTGAGWLHHHTTRFDDLIRQAAVRQSVDFWLVKALIFEESWFRPKARGEAGELGLMQLTAAAAKDFTARKGLFPVREDRLLEPRLNLEIGCWYLRQSLNRYQKTPRPELFALLRYNAGETRADSWVKRVLASPAPAGVDVEDHYFSLVDFPKTREYARRILKRARSRSFWF